ncbi:phosphoribosylglycinamide formyltransferase [Flexivirga meconopsidis]|uniref:phosphoribosylglycinamide formyltransferase n=1 Tax=Flexivirga meconopsidis TaxID=2977121 RepID=UPI00223F9508
MINDSAAPGVPASGPVPIVVLVSGSGTLLQALLDASADPEYGVQVVAVGADRDGIEGLARAERAGVPTFVHRVRDYADRAAWDRAVSEDVASYHPELVVSAGFLKLVGESFLERFGGRYLNSHNALLPSFPGIHGPRDALDYGVKVTGATLFVVDAGVDTGAIVAQCVVPVEDDDTVDTLTERIKQAERPQLVDWVGRLAREGFRVEGRRVVLGSADSAGGTDAR